MAAVRRQFGADFLGEVGNGQRHGATLSSTPGRLPLYRTGHTSTGADSGPAVNLGAPSIGASLTQSSATIRSYGIANIATRRLNDQVAEDGKPVLADAIGEGRDDGR